jgi:hypothetical protein
MADSGVSVCRVPTNGHTDGRVRDLSDPPESPDLTELYINLKGAGSRRDPDVRCPLGYRTDPADGRFLSGWTELSTPFRLI